MNLSRKFLNLIVDSRIPGSLSLGRIDLTRQHFFNRTTPPPCRREGNGSKMLAADAVNQNNKKAAKVGFNMERVRLTSPIINFGATTMTNHLDVRCFPLAGSEVLCSDQLGRTYVYDADTRNVVTVPDLKPKLWPLSLFIPNAGLDGHDASCGGSLFIMETVIKPEEGWSGQYSDQFEVFVYHKPTLTSSCQPLPPPPFVRDPKFHNIRTKISSYAVVSGGSEVCISVEGAGTYSFDTVKHTWRNLGQWTLPFNGKVEYVPELKLWFGLSAKTEQLAAADLSALDSQPELVKTWNELSPSEGWREMQDSQIVNLGAGRFCIARFFGIRSPKSYLYYDQIIEDYFAVLTGVEVVPCVDGNGSSCGNDKSSGSSSGQVKLQMVKHKSKLHLCNDGSVIMAVF